MSNSSAFSFRPLNLGAYALDDGARTVAIVTKYGWVDWLAPDAAGLGTRLPAIFKETHLAYVLGLKFELQLPGLTDTYDTVTRTHLPIEREILEDGARAALRAESRSADGCWRGEHRALIHRDPDTGRYAWALETRLVCAAAQPVYLPWIEYNNILPAQTGLCFLHERQKRFDRMLLRDRDGVVWSFPHQHLMHYGVANKVQPLRFAPGTIAGFFGEALNPVVIVEDSPIEPDWRICDMFYDLHCGARPPVAIAPGTEYVWRYRLLYLDAQATAPLLAQARPVPVTADDYRNFNYPRLSLGRNDFKDAVRIDGADDASGFRPLAPVRVWDRAVGPEGKGALRLTHDTPRETVWTAEPPSIVPPGRRLQLRALARTQDVRGKGFYLRVRVSRWAWEPEPKTEFREVITTVPLTGTSADWTPVATPALDFTADDPDACIWIDLLLDGTGTGWLTDLDVSLQDAPREKPAAPPPTARRCSTPA